MSSQVVNFDKKKKQPKSEQAKSEQPKVPQITASSMELFFFLGGGGDEFDCFDERAVLLCVLLIHPHMHQSTHTSPPWSDSILFGNTGWEGLL